jgi:hypothetical protein
LFSITGSGIDQNSSGVFGVILIVLELTWYPSDLLLSLDIYTMSPTNIELALYNE